LFSVEVHIAPVHWLHGTEYVHHVQSTEIYVHCTCTRLRLVILLAACYRSQVTGHRSQSNRYEITLEREVSREVSRVKRAKRHGLIATGTFKPAWRGLGATQRYSGKGLDTSSTTQLSYPLSTMTYPIDSLHITHKPQTHFIEMQEMLGGHSSTCKHLTLHPL